MEKKNFKLFTAAALLAILLILIFNHIRVNHLMMLLSNSGGTPSNPVIPCPAKGEMATACPPIALNTATTAFYVDTCINGDYKSFTTFCGINGGSMQTTNLMRAYNANPTQLNCLSYSYIFKPDLTNPGNSTLTVKFHLNNYSSGRINRQTGSDYYSDWLCPTYCPPSAVGSACAPATSGASTPLSLHTTAGGVIYYTNFCGSNGGNLSDAILKAIKADPNKNCISYSFIFVPNTSDTKNSRLALQFHLNHYDPTAGITVLSGTDFATEWLCPTICQ
jgi:hypothetical protein